MKASGLLLGPTTPARHALITSGPPWSKRKERTGPVCACFPMCRCIYGYSLSLFLPVTILNTVPSSGARWAVTMLAAVLSGTFLVVNFGCVAPPRVPLPAQLEASPS